MKKFIACILTILAIIFLTGAAYAGPEEVSIVPISKWNYKDVDGWGFYAKDGEYSWFGFILRNPGNTDYTVTLPKVVDVAHNTTHEIVNTAYKVMINGSKDFLYEGYKKVYFSESFTLPKDSTYSVFFDVTKIQPYNQQWDTDIFFSLQVSDQNRTRTLPITGVLAYDAKNTTPTKLTIVTQSSNQIITYDPNAAASASTAPVENPLTTVKFCRQQDSSNKKLTFSYALKNNTPDSILVELATSLFVEGFRDAVPVRYTGCTSGGSSCASRITDGNFRLKAGETAEFSGEATLPSNPPKSNFFIKTSLRYDYNGSKLIPYLVGQAADTCSAKPTAVPPTAVPTKTAAPVITTTPAPTSGGGLVSVRFCRSYDKATRKVSFAYTLKNNSSEKIPVELATSLAVEGQKDVVMVRYTGCTSGGSSCTSRISNGTFKMKAGETVEFRGEATLPANPSKTNFYIRTSLRYDFNGKKLIPLLVGYATDSCSSGTTPTVITVTPAPADDKGLVNVSFCRNYNSGNRKVTFEYTLKNNSSVTIPVELATSLAVEGIRTTVPVRYTNCISGGNRSCASRISGGWFNLKTGETAEFSGEATLPSQPANSSYFFIKTSLRYNYKGRTMIPFLVGYTSGSCTAAHDVSPDEIAPKSSEAKGKTGTYSVRLINNKDTVMTVLPGAFRLGSTAVTRYEGIAAISPVDVEISGHSDFAFTNGEEFILPPYSVADVTISINADPAIVIDISEEDITWEHTITSMADDSDGKQAKALSAGTNDTAEKDTGLQLFPIDPTRIPDRLPATGFSSRRVTNLSVQPETLAYRSLNGLHLDIPAILTSAEIVQVPLNEKGEWAVEWLNDRAGILADTPLPGSGISVIAAHNHLNDTENGPFIGLSLLKDNDRIFVEDNRSRMQAFSVYANLLLGPDDGSRIYETAAPDSLVLLTCESELEEGGYAFRRAVFAEPVE